MPRRAAAKYPEEDIWEEELPAEEEYPAEEAPVAEEAPIAEETPIEEELPVVERVGRVRARRAPVPEEDEEPPAPKKKKKKKNNGWKIGLVVALVIVLLLLGGAVTAAVLVRGVDTVYDGVTAFGVDLGGMTLEEARSTLDELARAKYDGFAVTAKLPLDNTLTITAEEVGLSCTAQGTADAAWNYGRSEGLFGAPVKYAQCRFLGKNSFESADELTVVINEETLRSRIAEAVTKIDEQLLENGITVGEKDIRITKGASGLTIDGEELFKKFHAAFMSGDDTPIVYEAELQMDEKFDFQGLYDEIHAEKAEAAIYYNPELLKSAKELYEKDAARVAATPDVEPLVAPVPEQTIPEGIDFNGEPYYVTRSVVGVSFDVAEAERLWAAANYGEEVVIPLKVEKPAVSTEEIEATLFRDGLSKNWTLVRLYEREPSTEVRTSLSGSTQDRISNVKLACEKINGTILVPGQVFSYNDALGERLDTLGWLPATAYANGEVRQEYGGGICQVSSTLYNAALYSNLQIVERECHQFQVGYLPWGMDATVSWGWPDFKFQNDREYPIMIKAHVDDETNEVCVEIVGTDTDHTYVLMRFNNWEFFDNDGKYWDADGNPVAVGMEAATWRCLYHDGDDYDAVDPISKVFEINSKYNYHTEDILAKAVGSPPAADTGDAEG